MKFLVIGCGSIGERHIPNLKKLSSGKILAFDIDSKRLSLMKKKHNVETYQNLKKAYDQKPDAVLICTPPNLHIPMAMKAVNHCSNIFIEKPLSHNLQGIDRFLREVEKKKITVLVGYNLRFHEGIRKIKKMIDGKEYLLDEPLAADYSFVRASKADRRGNLIYRGSGRGANPIMAMAGNVTISEVDEIVEVGELDPESIVTPSIFVDRIVRVPDGALGSLKQRNELCKRYLMSEV